MMAVGVRLLSPELLITPRSHCTSPSTDLIDFPWGALEVRCGSILSVGSLACVKKLTQANFSGTTDPSANRIVSPLLQTSPPLPVDGRVQCERTVEHSVLPSRTDPKPSSSLFIPSAIGCSGGSRGLSLVSLQGLPVA
jgi:hypothetical protein